MKRSRLLAAHLVAINRTSGIPLHRQIATALRDSIRDGSLVAGTLLPSTRDLAREIGVSRNTVMVAYETLAGQALVICTVGSGTRVSSALPIVKVYEGVWRRAVRETRFPQRIATFLDQDGNLLYVSSR